MTTVLGIDLGTQSVKAICYDAEVRETVAVGSASLDVYRDASGAAEQRATWWIEALKLAIAKLSPTARAAVSAIGVSGQQHGFVPLDDKGDVLAPVKLWCDTSTAKECVDIMSSFGGAADCLREVGNLIMPGYTASKVRWLRDHHPALYAQMKTILLPHDYLNFYLTGELCMEAGDASGTGFLDVRTRTWSQKMLAALDPDRDLRACLPEVALGNRPIGALRAAVASELGLPVGVPVSAGGGDNMMGAIGTGNVAPGVVSMSLGTSGTAYAYAEAPVVDDAGDIAAFCSSTGGWLPLLCTMNCTASTELMRHLFDVDLERFESQVAAAPPGSAGVLTVPFFNGERTPNLPKAKGTLWGLDSQNARQENILRSAVEGATYGLRFGLQRLKQLGVETREIVVTGGGSQSATWRQITSDVCNAPVTVLKQNEGAAFGAALQALELLDKPSGGLPALVSTHLERVESRCCVPHPPSVALYNETYSHYQGALQHVADHYA